VNPVKPGILKTMCETSPKPSNRFGPTSRKNLKDARGEAGESDPSTIHDPSKNLKHHVGPDKRIAAAETPWRLRFYPPPQKKLPDERSPIYVRRAVFAFVGQNPSFIE
jgi:hypothetical protein